MSFGLVLGGTIMGAILVFALYIWAYRSLSRKWKGMSDTFKLTYAIVFLCFGPVPVLILLALNVGTTDGYFAHSTVRTVYVEVPTV